MVIDANLMKVNAEALLKENGKAKAILRELNGKQDYKVVAKKVGVPACRVSCFQKQAARLGFAKKVGAGIYKKEQGVMAFIPEKYIVQAKKSDVPHLLKRISKRKHYGPSASSTKLPSSISTALDPMAEIYRDLYVTENLLRELIRTVLSGIPNWWKTRIPSDIQTDVQNTISKTPYDAATRKDELEYTHLGQLTQIIITNQNWAVFQPYLHEKDRESFRVTINKAVPTRHCIGHCIPLKSEDLKTAKVRFQDILKMIK